MRTRRPNFIRFFREDVAQGLTEYALLLALLALAAAGVLSQTGVTLQAPWKNASTTLESASGPSWPTPAPPASTGDPGTGGGDHNRDHDGHGDH